MPKIAGIDSFEGEIFHSARWRHDIDLEGKNVGVIGTGASAVQFVPEIANVAGTITVFQRTPPWILPRDDRPSPQWRRTLYRRIPGLQRLHRWRIYLRQEMLSLAFIGRGRIASRSPVAS
jgi:cation diffusion facilitator CzcD-associated flavoprotein CzcO